MVQGLGPWRTVTTEERHPALPCIRTRTLDHYEISELYATADNLILLVVCRSSLPIVTIIDAGFAPPLQNSSGAPGGQVIVLTFE